MKLLHRLDRVRVACDLEPRQRLRLKLVGGEHGGARHHLLPVDRDELLRHVEPPVVAQDGVAHVDARGVLGAEHLQCVHDSPEDGGRAHVSCEEVGVVDESILLHPAHKVLQLRALQRLPSPTRVPCVV
eukprot:CAMPEP_0173456562 /NCGR_PEP_ID=MMETSP1357-20121228/56248_1 /TAXON_ID=77926 /ORGANISM="Hemiselmis rufescens, Strain PCC563" /LENGTH=128 /DNA_ID=CAMNT_0014423797 /DNA_START=38 /DNA_END=424 /DNA_ORIENTATION=-